MASENRNETNILAPGNVESLHITPDNAVSLWDNLQQIPPDPRDEESYEGVFEAQYNGRRKTALDMVNDIFQRAIKNGKYTPEQIRKFHGDQLQRINLLLEEKDLEVITESQKILLQKKMKRDLQEGFGINPDISRKPQEHYAQAITVLQREYAKKLGMKEIPFHFSDWMQVIVHSHAKLADLSFGEGISPEDTRMLQMWREGQLPLTVFLEALRTLFESRGGGYLVYMDHAGQSKFGQVRIQEGMSDEKIAEIHEEAEQMRIAYARENLPKTVEELSNNVLKLKAATSQLETIDPDLANRLFVGIEVDLLYDNGTLNISNEVLQQLDYVGVSYHGTEWRIANGNRPTLEQICSAYEHVAENSLVDTINHPFRALPEDVKTQLAEHPEAFDNFLKLMARSGKAIEINLIDFIGIKFSRGTDLNLQLITRAKQFGIKFILGTDFHQLQNYALLVMNNPENSDEPIRKQGFDREIQKAFKDLMKVDFFETPEQSHAFEQRAAALLVNTFEPKSKGSVNPNLLKLARGIFGVIQQIERIGITPDDILNGDVERFRQWLEQRRIAKDIQAG